jgi:hypothetical protein
MPTEDRAMLVCHPDPSMSCSAEFSFWANVAEALHARAELTPSGPLCLGAHSVARLDLEPDPRCWLSSRIRTKATADAIASNGADT